MKKTTILFFAALALSCAVRAQAFIDKERGSEFVAVSVGPAFGSWPESTSNDITVDANVRYLLHWNLSNTFSLGAEPEVAFLSNSYTTAAAGSKNWGLFGGLHITANYKPIPDLMLSLGIGGLMCGLSQHTGFALDANGDEVDGSRSSDAVALFGDAMGVGKYSIQLEAKYNLGRNFYCSLTVRELTTHLIEPVSTLVMVGAGYRLGK